MFLIGGGGNPNIAEEMTDRLFSQFKSEQIFVISFAKNNDEAKERMYSILRPSAQRYQIELIDGINPKLYKKKQIVYIPGGNQDKLLEELNSEEYMSILNSAAKNKTLVGDSAGSVVLGEIMFSGYNKDTARLKDGLGILKNTLIIPHLGNPGFEEWILPVKDQARNQYSDLNILGIKEGEFLESEYPFDFEQVKMNTNKDILNVF